MSPDKQKAESVEKMDHPPAVDETRPEASQDGRPRRAPDLQRAANPGLDGDAGAADRARQSATMQQQVGNARLGESSANKGDGAAIQRQPAHHGVEESPDRFDQLHADPASILNQINPGVGGGEGMLARFCRLNCPATAAALDSYLRTGQIDRAHCDLVAESSGGIGYEIIEGSFGPSLRWLGGSGARARIFHRTHRHGDFVVVEGDRGPDPPSGLSRYHYFVVVRIRDQRFIVDAFTRQVTDEINDYVTWLGTTRYKLVTGAFRVRPVH